MSMEEKLIHDSHESLYNSDLKHIEANLEKFIKKKEEELMRKRGVGEN